MVPLVWCVVVALLGACCGLDVVVDTDCNTDDAMALLYLLKVPHVTIKGVTTQGNGWANQGPGVTNFKDLLHWMGSVTPVAPGAVYALADEGPLTDRCHFRDTIPRGSLEQSDTLAGLMQGIPRAPTGWSGTMENATSLLTRLLEEATEPLYILCIGTLTNVHWLLTHRPDLTPKIGHVYVMGGAVEFAPCPTNATRNCKGNMWHVPPNTNSVSEYNIYLDPHAARSVLTSTAISVTLVPLDATNTVPFTPEFWQYMEDHTKTKEGHFVLDLLTDIRKNWRGGDESFFTSYYLWDPFAAGILVDHSFCAKMRTMNIDVVARESATGYTCSPDEDGDTFASEGGRSMSVCTYAAQGTSGRMPTFMEEFIQRLNSESLT